MKKDPGVPNLFPYKDRILHEIEETRRLKEEAALRRKEEARTPGSGHVVDGEQKTDVDEDVPMDVDGLGMANDEARIDDDDDEDEDIMDEVCWFSMIMLYPSRINQLIMVPIQDDDDADSVDPMAALVMSARVRAVEYRQRQHRGRKDDGSGDENEDEDDDRSMKHDAPLRRDRSRKAFDDLFKQVLDAADVILYVLDARDPDGTRSRAVERTVMAADGGRKRLILVLNKIDLVPMAVLKGWLKYLSRYFPTLPLRASTHANGAHIFHHRQLSTTSTSSTLLKALKSFAATKQLRRSISVGVIGYPNVGKSSVINALTSRLGPSSTGCPVGAEAGMTTSLRQTKLDRKLTLIDSPGIIFPSNEQDGGSSSMMTQDRLVLLNAIPPKQIEDPIPAVSLLLNRLTHQSPLLLQSLLDLYSLPALMPSESNGGGRGEEGDQTTDFLIHVARKRGRLGKGGLPNLHSAAMAVLTDWRDGRIQGWMEPPLTMTGGGHLMRNVKEGEEVLVAGDVKSIVSEWAAEFNLDNVDDE